jgi:hypothetical protein
MTDDEIAALLAAAAALEGAASRAVARIRLAAMQAEGAQRRMQDATPPLRIAPPR